MRADRRKQVQDTLHNPHKRAPEHVQLVKNLISCDHSTHANETHLPTDVNAWETLGSHMDAVVQPLTRVCFQCGMRNYPQGGDTIRVTNVTKKQDCRAYRVFKYYIRKLVKDECARLPPNANQRHARAACAREHGAPGALPRRARRRHARGRAPDVGLLHA